MGNGTSPEPADADILADQARNAPLTRPRPGHADPAGMQIRPGCRQGNPGAGKRRGNGRAVALGEVARRVRQVLGAEMVSDVVALGPVRASEGDLPGPRTRNPS